MALAAPLIEWIASKRLGRTLGPSSLALIISQMGSMALMAVVTAVSFAATGSSAGGLWVGLGQDAYADVLGSACGAAFTGLAFALKAFMSLNALFVCVAAGSVGFIATYGRPEAGEWSADQLVLLQAASHAMHACMEQWHNVQQQRRAEDEAHRLREKLQQRREDAEGQSTQLRMVKLAVLVRPYLATISSPG